MQLFTIHHNILSFGPTSPALVPSNEVRSI